MTRPALLSVGLVLLFVAGYAWVLSLFLLRVPLIDLDRTVDAGDLPVFQVPHVGHFEGLEVSPTGRELTYRLPAFVLGGSTKTLEVFVAPAPGNDREDLPPVRLTQDDRSSRITETRTEVEWNTPGAGDKRLLLETAPDSDDDSRALVAIRAHDASPWTLALVLTLAGLGCLVAAHRVRPLSVVRSPAALPLVLLLVGMLVFWSGALISIDYFGGSHGRLSGMAIHLTDLATTGSLNATQYRPATFVIPALPGALLEGTQLPLRDIVRVYPVTEYSLFVTVVLSFGFLVHAWATRVDRTSAAALAVLLATFYPFIHDTFFPDTDAFLIPLFAAITALAVLWCRPRGVRRSRIVVLALPLLLLAMSLKATSLVFLVMLPALVYGAGPARSYRQRWLEAGAALLVLVLLLPLGDWLDRAFQHPDRNVGVAELPFQDSAVWHVLWGGAGYFDHYTAFQFTANGGLRRERVAEALGAENDAYLHQAQQATDEVYRPGILNALKEMPSIFYSNAFNRLQRQTLRLYRYTGGTGGLIKPWTDPETARIDYLNGQESYPEKHRTSRLEESIRLDRYWRIAPLVLLVRLQQGALPQALDIALLALAVVGLSLVRVPGLRWFLLFGVLLQLAMASGVHSLFRYGAFLSTCSLIGLATLLGTSWRVLSNRADLADSAETGPG